MAGPCPFYRADVFCIVTNFVFAGPVGNELEIFEPTFRNQPFTTIRPFSEEFLLQVSSGLAFNAFIVCL
jgi:hypothetical protein